MHSLELPYLAPSNVHMQFVQLNKKTIKTSESATLEFITTSSYTLIQAGGHHRDLLRQLRPS